MNKIEKAIKNINEAGYLDIDTSKIDYIKEINKLKKEKNAIILAHYYQIDEIQEIADFVGDSLALAQRAAKTEADMIVFAGVHFMAETAKILNPTKKVVLPDLKAGCSLADSCPPVDFSAFKKLHPNHVVVTYINCSAEIKALSDYVCTSSNAKMIIDSIPKETPIIFAPDRNLGAWLKKETGREKVFTGDIEAQLIALRCSEVPEGYNHWTFRLLADKMVELEYVESISHESVRQLLKKTKLSPGK